MFVFLFIRSFTDISSLYHAPCLCTLKYETVERLSSVWYPKCHSDAPDAPIILVGTTNPDLSKTDDENENAETIPLEEIQAKAKEIGAHEYIKCDLRSRSDTEQVFSHAVRAAREALPSTCDQQCETTEASHKRTVNRGCSLQ